MTTELNGPATSSRRQCPFRGGPLRGGRGQLRGLARAGAGARLDARQPRCGAPGPRQSGGRAERARAGSAVEPADLEAWSHQGVVLAALGRHAEALACHDRVLGADPGAGRTGCSAGWRWRPRTARRSAGGIRSLHRPAARGTPAAGSGTARRCSSSSATTKHSSPTTGTRARPATRGGLVEPRRDPARPRRLDEAALATGRPSSTAPTPS